MATIGFQLIGKKEEKSIYVRITIERGNQIKQNTGLKAKLSDWSIKKKYVKSQGSVGRKKLSENLEKFETDLQKEINSAIAKGEKINNSFLKDFINKKTNKFKDTDLNILTNLFGYYIENNDRVTKATLTKYNTVKTKIENYEKHAKERVLIKEVKEDFKNSFKKYLVGEEKISISTVSKYFSTIKTICRYGNQKHDLEIHNSLDSLEIKGEETKPIFLSFDEIDKIKDTEMFSEALNNARDWLVLGCYLGQRVSDLLNLTNEKIHLDNGIKILKLTQKKTGSEVEFPLPVEALSLLEEKGSFPRRISDQKFNKHIKQVCKIAGITQEIQGSLMQEAEIQGKKQYRKVKGLYPKYELVTSHICRRSFATNYYSLMPTTLLRRITGHATEEMFLKYIGETQKKDNELIYDYFNAIHKEREKAKAEKERLTIKQAN